VQQLLVPGKATKKKKLKYTTTTTTTTTTPKNKLKKYKTQWRKYLKYCTENINYLHKGRKKK
jgi:hypothetical protein